ncbi:MAG: serine/threonine protein kinase [Verrucomicrobiales bacterium]|nr:serine/threonine protein kinase [Verrucomicrobiales bacterium]
MSDRYQIKQTLGRGGMGAVYHAFDTVMKRDVALKRLLPIEETNLNESADESLKREAAALARFSHPNIVTIYAFEEDEDGPYVVMELVDGEDLKQIVDRGALAVEDFIDLAEQTLDPLIAAGQLNLLHRDIKPANIMLNWLATGKFQAKILDFGLAKFSEKPQAQTLDQQGFFLGSIDFLTPEQLLCRPLDQRTDLYSLGCVLYFCLAQESPFHGDNPADTTQRHMQHLCTRIKDIRDDMPQPLADWLMRMISRHPENRPADARAALEEFQAAKAGKSPLPKQASAQQTVVTISDSGVTTDTISPVKMEEEEEIPVARLVKEADGAATGPTGTTGPTGPRMILVGEKMEARPPGPRSSKATAMDTLPGNQAKTPKPVLIGLCVLLIGVVIALIAAFSGNDGKPSKNSNSPGKNAVAKSKSDKGKQNKGKAKQEATFERLKPKFPPLPTSQFKNPAQAKLPALSDPDGSPPVTEGLWGHFRANTGVFQPDLKTPAKPEDRIGGWANLAPGVPESSDLFLHPDDFEVVSVPQFIKSTNQPPFAASGLKPDIPLLKFEQSAVLRMPNWKNYEKTKPLDSLSFVIAVRAKNQSGHFLRLDANRKGGFIQAKPGKNMLEVHVNHIPGGNKKLQLQVPEGKFVVMSYVLDGPGKTHNLQALGAGGKRYGSAETQPVNFPPVKLRHYQVGMYHNLKSRNKPPPFFNGHIAELLLFSKALTKSERESLEKHLANRYLK